MADGDAARSLTDSLKSLFIEMANTLKGSARRLFMARTVKELGSGGQPRAEREPGWNREAIRLVLAGTSDYLGLHWHMCPQAAAESSEGEGDGFFVPQGQQRWRVAQASACGRECEGERGALV